MTADIEIGPDLFILGPNLICEVCFRNRSIRVVKKCKQQRQLEFCFEVERREVSESISVSLFFILFLISYGDLMVHNGMPLCGTSVGIGNL